MAARATKEEARQRKEEWAQACTEAEARAEALHKELVHELCLARAEEKKKREDAARGKEKDESRSKKSGKDAARGGSGKTPRREEALRPLEGPVKRARFMVFDIESKAGPSQHPGFTRPFLCGFYDGERFRAFRNMPQAEALPWRKRHTAKGGCIDRFLSVLFSRTDAYKNTTIYAHNGGNFDFLFLLAWLRARPHLQFAIVPIQSTIQVLKVWRRGDKKGGTWTFLDSLKLLPMSLAEAGKALGLGGKLDMSLHTDERSDLWEEYNEKDCRLLYEILEKTHELVEEKLGGEVGITTPSTSMKLFRRKYLGQGRAPSQIPRHLHFASCKKTSCRGCAHAWVRLGYYGGRTEIHRMRGQRLRYYDLNSSYPASMMMDMPAGNKVETTTYEPSRYEKLYTGFVECTVYIPPECEIPPLPFRADSGKLLFPTGVFSGVWSTEELALLDHPRVKGWVVSTVRCVWYRRVSVFVDMVQDLYAYRDKSRSDYDEGLSTLAKLILNSLYGKFGMKEERESIVILPRGEKPPRGAKPAGGDTACGVWYATKVSSPSYVIPQIAAHITALARVRLWKVMCNALDLGGLLYYCDTDSVITDVELPTGNALGELKDEHPGETLEMEFLQPKVYTAVKPTPFSKVHLPTCTTPKCGGCSHVKVTMKGLPKRERTPTNMLKLRAGGAVSFKRLEKVRSLARKGFHTSPVMVKVSKSIVSAYDKRIVLPDGGTRAIVLGLGE